MSRTDAILKRLSQLHPKLIDLSLDRMLPLLARLGNPQDHLPPTSLPASLMRSLKCTRCGEL